MNIQENLENSFEKSSASEDSFDELAALKNRRKLDGKVKTHRKQDKAISHVGESRNIGDENSQKASEEDPKNTDKTESTEAGDSFFIVNKSHTEDEGALNNNEIEAKNKELEEKSERDSEEDSKDYLKTDPITTKNGAKYWRAAKKGSHVPGSNKARKSTHSSTTTTLYQRSLLKKNNKSTSESVSHEKEMINLNLPRKKKNEIPKPALPERNLSNVTKTLSLSESEDSDSIR